MVRATVEEINRDPGVYIGRVEAGETVVVMRSDRAVAEIRPVAVAVAGERPSGLCAGEFIVPDDFDAPLPDDVIAAFEGR